ncbi:MULTISPECIES: hypothetical protein [Shewanella]|uniref:hypothetical protein n=1 Tax=Shewanella TaxID=22 RepID=UPI00217D9250|nr:hypothetical protein [Shewanella baltica]
MAIKLKKTNLQGDVYDYTWSRDKGDGEYAGVLDAIKVDKDEGYEVLYFIQVLMNKHNLTLLKDVHKIEDALHNSKLSSVVLRTELNEAIEKALSL